MKNTNIMCGKTLPGWPLGHTLSDTGAMKETPTPHFFETPDSMREWLEANHRDASELIQTAHMIPMGVCGYDTGKRTGLDTAGGQLIHRGNSLAVRRPLYPRD